MSKLGGKLADAEKVKFETVLLELRDPVSCWNRYLSQSMKADSTNNEGLQEEDLEEGEPVDDGSDCLSSVRASFNKPIGMVLDLVIKLMRGAYFQDCRRIASNTNPGAFLKTLEDKDCKEQCDLVKDLRIILEHFETNQKSVSLSTAVPEVGLLQGLKAQGPDGVDAAVTQERERLWKVVQNERRKYISFSVPKHWTKDAILASFRSCGKVYAHSGALNSSHRLICASADLFREDGLTPWATQSPPGTDWGEVISFAAGCTGACDFIMLLDGRMREARRMHESWWKRWNRPVG